MRERKGKRESKKKRYLRKVGETEREKKKRENARARDLNRVGEIT